MLFSLSLLIPLIGIFIITISMFYGFFNNGLRYVKVVYLIKSLFASILKSFTLAKLTAAFISLSLIILLRYTIAGGFYTNPLNIEETLKIGIPAIFLRIGIQGIIDYIFEDLGLRIFLENIWNGPKDSDKMTIGSNSDFQEKKPTNYLYLAAQSDNGGEGPSNYQNNKPNSAPTTPIPSTPADNNSPSYYDKIAYEDAFHTDSTVSTVSSCEGGNPRTKEELMVDVNKLQDIATERRRAAHQFSLDIEVYKEATKVLNKKVEDRTAEDLEIIQRVINTGCDNPTLLNVQRNIKNSSILRARAIDKAHLAAQKALVAVSYFDLKDMVFKQPEFPSTLAESSSTLVEPSSTLVDSTEMEKSNNLNKGKRKMDFNDDNDYISKRTRSKTSRNKKN
jgi:hypothetical protein